MDFLSVVSGLFKPVADTIDSLHTSDEERIQAKTALFGVQSAFMTKALEYEQKIMEAQASVIKAEAASGSWLTSNWRPVTMMVFLGLIVSWWLGWTPERATPELVQELFGLIKIGLGGYVIGRSVEKVAPAVTSMMRKE